MKNAIMKDNLPLDSYYKKLSTELVHLEKKYKICLFKNNFCNKIIKAHSIPESSLNRIADANKNIYVSRILSSTEQSEIKKNNTFIPKKERTSKFSTFYGMCGYHDNKIFEEIENKTIIPSEMQNIKLFFRTLVYNYYLKLPGKEILDKLKDTYLPKNYDSHEFKEKLRCFYQPMVKIQMEMNDEIKLLKKSLLGEKLIELNYLFLRIDSIPELMCCECIIPIYDLNGKLLYKNKKEMQKHPIQNININISSDSDGGYIHFAWHKDYDICNRFIASLKDHKYNMNKIICYIFYKLYNYAYNINWWNNQSIIKKKSLMYYYSEHIQQRNIEGSILKLIAEDHKKYIKWKIIDIKETL